MFNQGPGHANGSPSIYIDVPPNGYNFSATNTTSKGPMVRNTLVFGSSHGSAVCDIGVLIYLVPRLASSYYSGSKSPFENYLADPARGIVWNNYNIDYEPITRELLEATALIQEQSVYIAQVESEVKRPSTASTAVIFPDSVNIRCATGTRNMQDFTMQNATTLLYLLLAADRSILFEFAGSLHLAEGYETVDGVRTAKSVTFTTSSPRIEEKEKIVAGETAELVTGLFGKRDATLGLERMNANIGIALKELGLNILDTQKPVEMA
ncbi:hypothetical protein FZEAL_2780 [Fusarium zealandicum]|uniref:Uncharacterized protein n=1 Tax=Fusarium zealandicum TaxID=1053134 RepID=A0A8H4UQ25_9HYPO|nr:hypothetical protein FZEAL_2780 [Fusarium zealandicum]